MIKKVFFLFVLISTISFSQEKKLDSIKQLLETYKKEDTTRVSMLIDLTKYYHSRDFNDGLPLAQEALALAKKIGYKRGEGYSLNSLSTFYVIKGELDKGIAYALQAKKILEEIKDTDNLIFTHNLLARIYTKNQQPEKALELHIQELPLQLLVLGLFIIPKAIIKKQLKLQVTSFLFIKNTIKNLMLLIHRHYFLKVILV